MRLWLLLAALIMVIPACARTGRELTRDGDEIMVAGRLFHTGAPVVLWTDPGGYDAYRTERRFVAWEEASWEATSKVKSLEGPNRYGVRAKVISPETLERVRGGGWDLPTLQLTVTQFVIHYDVCGTSRQCFRVLHDMRGLSVHFMLDIDGTIYQTLDLKERAWHAGAANDRSIGIEIANIGAYSDAELASASNPLARWYGNDDDGKTRITIPSSMGDGGVRTPGFVGRPARDEPVRGVIHGRELSQYDLTPEQYGSLIRLTAALCRVFPNLECDYPRGPDGALRRDALSEAELAGYTGLLGHFHVTPGKIDPGPAFDWDRVVKGARRVP